MRRTVRIVNRTQGTLLASRIQLADSWWGRFRGYLGRSRPESGEGILLVPCNAVHTFGMAFGLDVIFLDARGEVVKVLPEMKPWRKTDRVSNARYVLEVPEGTIQASGTAVGDRLTWTWTPTDRLSMQLQETP